ncbi:hypothetical protein [Yersinia intermedia]|uniref:hypothetical protein n=1 Tax=Yersinia intermedia TaxID=631 RepID=UPI00065D3E1F|nr:hypothetical protein [Yersinia intermedia]CRY84061.1 Uncharacterised protein [Yersinia intermedia]
MNGELMKVSFYQKSQFANVSEADLASKLTTIEVDCQTTANDISNIADAIAGLYGDEEGVAFSIEK